MTHEEFIKILPAYMGCEVQMPGGEIGHLSEVADDGNITCADTVEAYAKTGYKLILRAGTDITDEEKAVTIVNAMKLVKSESIEDVAKMIRYQNSIGVDTDGLLQTEYAIRKTESKP
jgi:hypothetical protein